MRNGEGISAHSPEPEMADWKDRLEEEIHRQNLDMKSVSRRAGLGGTYIRDVLRRGYGAGIDPIARIAQVLGVSVDWLITGMGEARGSETPIRVIGTVAAGVWMELDENIASLEEAPISPFPADPRYPSEAQFDLVVRGNSINRVAHDGDRIRCVSVTATGVVPREHDLVVVRRRRDGLEETTVKRAVRQQGELLLMPESTDPRWQQPIRIDAADGVEVSIVARALYAYRPL